MYYVKRGQKDYFIARGPKFQEDAWVGNLPDLEVLYYDYDDLSHWNDVALAKESRIVGDANLDDFDPAGFAAAQREMQRRAGIDSTPWFDNLDDLFKDLDNAADGDDDDDGRKPVVTPESVDSDTRKLIRDLAKLERDRWDGKNPSMEDIFDLHNRIMKTRFARLLCDGIDEVEDWKIVAAHLLFIYAQERQIAELEGRKPNEDFLMAGSSLYNVAALEQILDDE